MNLMYEAGFNGIFDISRAGDAMMMIGRFHDGRNALAKMGDGDERCLRNTNRLEFELSMTKVLKKQRVSVQQFIKPVYTGRGRLSNMIWTNGGSRIHNEPSPAQSNC